MPASVVPLTIITTVSGQRSESCPVSQTPSFTDRHQHIRKHDVGGRQGHLLERLGGASDRPDFVPPMTQAPREQFLNGHLVVDYENLCHARTIGRRAYEA